MEVDGGDAINTRATAQPRGEHVVNIPNEQQDSSQLTWNNYMNNMTGSWIHQFVNYLFGIMVMRALLAITECIPSLEGLDKAARVFEKLVLVWGKAVVLSGFVVMLEMKDFEFIALMCLFIFMRISCRSHMPELSKVMHLVSAMTCVCSIVFSAMQLVSQNFGETEEKYKATRNLTLNAFYVMALTNALVSIVYHALNVVLY